MGATRDHTLLALTMLSASVGCAGHKSLGQHMDESWVYDGGTEASALLERINPSQVHDAIPAAVGLTQDGVVGRQLPDKKIWTYVSDRKANVLPSLVGDAVLFTEGSEKDNSSYLTMLDVATGEVRFSIDVQGRRLEGAGFDGEHAVLLMVDPDNSRQDQLMVVDRQGAVKFQTTAIARLGTPAAVQGVGLVPYSSQYVAGFDLVSGKLLGRVLYRDGLHSVTVDEGSLFVLGTGVSELSSRMAQDPSSHSLKLDPRRLPGEPVWPLNGSEPRYRRAAPVGLYAHPEVREGRVRFSEGTYIATYFQIVAGFEHGTGELKFVSHFPQQVVGGDASSAGTTLCLENGDIVQVSFKDGARSPVGSLAHQLRACVVTADHKAVTGAVEGDLFEQIVATLAGTGPDMVPMQRLLLDEMADRSGPLTTRALLDVARDPMVSSELARRAVALLDKQEEGGEEMIRVLLEAAPAPEQPEGDDEGEDPEAEGDNEKADDRDSEAGDSEADDSEAGDSEKADDWEEADDSEEDQGDADSEEGPEMPPPVESTATRRSQRPPPVGAIARALLRLKTPGSAAALVPYLRDLSLQPGAVLAVMTTILELGGTEQVEAVHDFLLGYKNTGGERALLDALVLATKFIDRYGTAEQKAELEAAIQDSLTDPDLRVRSGQTEDGSPPDDEGKDTAEGNSESPKGAADPQDAGVKPTK